MLSLNPTRLKKYKDVAWLLVKYGGSDLVTEAGLEDALIDEQEKEMPDSAGPDDLARDLEKLGPTFVKLGQVLSTRSDLLPQPYLDALSRLQDDVEPVPFEHIENTVVDELGVEFSEVFSYFEAEPLASASLGQVHRAVLTDGTDVAVKVQRPGVRKQVASDLSALTDLAEMLDAHTEFGKKYQFTQIIESLRSRIVGELDYQNEARNCQSLTENLSDRERIVIPQICEALSTSRVLTMQFMKGKKITELSEQELAEIDRDQLVGELFSAYLDQVLVDGVFHADPHPGNLFMLPDGRIALMDFGMVVHVPTEMQQNLAKVLLSISEGHGEETARDTLAISICGDRADKDEFTRRIAQLVTEHHDRPVRDLDAGAIVLSIQSVAGECGIVLPDEMRMIGKTLLNLDRIVAVLDPDFDPNAAIREHTSKILRDRMSDHVSLSRIYKSMMESAELAQAVPERLNKFTKLLAENELRVNVDAIDQASLVRSLHKIANRITTGLVLAALIIGASLMMRLETPFTIFGYPGIAMLFFLTAAIAGLVLVYRMMFHDHADCEA